MCNIIAIYLFITCDMYNLYYCHKIYLICMYYIYLHLYLYQLIYYMYFFFFFYNSG